MNINKGISNIGSIILIEGYKVRKQIVWKFPNLGLTTTHTHTHIFFKASGIILSNFGKIRFFPLKNSKYFSKQFPNYFFSSYFVPLPNENFLRDLFVL